MVGRGALIKPWIFEEFKLGRELQPTVEERVGELGVVGIAGRGPRGQGRGEGKPCKCHTWRSAKQARWSCTGMRRKQLLFSFSSYALVRETGLS